MLRRMDEIQKQLDDLLRSLTLSETKFALFYLQRRQQKYDGTHFFSVDDATRRAILDMAEAKLELPEVVRFRLHYLLGIQRSVEAA